MNLDGIQRTDHSPREELERLPDGKKMRGGKRKSRSVNVLFCCWASELTLPLKFRDNCVTFRASMMSIDLLLFAVQGQSLSVSSTLSSSRRMIAEGYE